MIRAIRPFIAFPITLTDNRVKTKAECFVARKIKIKLYLEKDVILSGATYSHNFRL